MDNPFLLKPQRLREYAEKNRFSVIHEFQLTESSTKQKHEKNSIKSLESLQNRKNASHLVVDTVDRLQRSFKESVDTFRVS